MKANDLFGEDMRRLLNTIYVTNEAAYLTLDGENLVCKIEGKEKLRIPFENIENVVCFSYLGCSPALMGKCVEKTVPINFISPQGKFWAKVCGETKGNVCNSVQREHDKKLNNGLPILHMIPPYRDYGRYFCIMAEKGGTM